MSSCARCSRTSAGRCRSTARPRWISNLTCWIRLFKLISPVQRNSRLPASPIRRVWGVRSGRLPQLRTIKPPSIRTDSTTERELSSASSTQTSAFRKQADFRYWARLCENAMIVRVVVRGGIGIQQLSHSPVKCTVEFELSPPPPHRRMTAASRGRFLLEAPEPPHVRRCPNYRCDSTPAHLAAIRDQ